MNQVYYHYTNREGAVEISRSQLMRASNLNQHTRDAMFGEGVYFTKLDPTYGKRAIAINNWSQGADKRIRDGYVDYAIKVTFPWGEWPSRPNDARRRDLYLWNGDLDLENYEFEIVMVERAVESASRQKSTDKSVDGSDVLIGASIIGGLALAGIGLVTALAKQ